MVISPSKTVIQLLKYYLEYFRTISLIYNEGCQLATSRLLREWFQI